MVVMVVVGVGVTWRDAVVVVLVVVAAIELGVRWREAIGGSVSSDSHLGLRILRLLEPTIV